MRLLSIGSEHFRPSVQRALCTGGRLQSTQWIGPSFEFDDDPEAGHTAAKLHGEA
jgi:hypothetical protein